jgi:ABC-type branched-subunit amino acid transport system substrate-binding protein
MQRAGVQMIYVIASDAPTMARLFTAARQQRVTWPLIGGGPSYDEGFTARAGAAGEGSFNDQQFAPFFSKEEAARTPSVAEFQKWTNKVAPGEKKDLFGVFGWASTQLFVQALKAAGPKATRSDLLAQLRKVTAFDADGLIAKGNPAGKKPPNCWLLMTVKNGSWQRVSPDQGFRCDGPYYYQKK